MAENAFNPHDLVKKSDVEKTLKIDKGSDAIFKSFQVVDFTTKGDNYACFVSSVVVQYEKPVGESFETSYVVKLNPRQSGILGDMMGSIFRSETEFYVTFLPMLNEELIAANEEVLRTAKHFNSVTEKEHEVIYLEDLRQEGFRMHSRYDGMDKPHVDLIIKELARLHAASVIMFNKQGVTTENVFEKFPILRGNVDEFSKSIKAIGMDVFKEGMENMAKLIAPEPDYKHVTDYIESVAPKAGDLFEETMKVSEPFLVIRHGDCWNNNFLFRYSPENVPVDCRLLDFQMMGVASNVLDLQHILFPCMDSKLRQQYMQEFLGNYYEKFTNILKLQNETVKFSLEELALEMKSKIMFGFLMCGSMVPAVLLPPEDAPNLAEFFSADEGRKEAMEEYTARVVKLTRASPSFRPRLLDMFDEMKEYGLYKNN